MYVELFLLLVVLVLVGIILKLYYSNLNILTGLDDLAVVADEVTTHAKFKHAIVCGGSAAGLVSARVLLNHFEHVTIIDPDSIDSVDYVSKYATQQQFTHVMRGFFVICLRKLFPSIDKFLNENGVRWIDLGSMKHHCWGSWMPHANTGVYMVLCTRPLIEKAMKTIMLEKYASRLTFLPNTTVTGLIPGEKIVLGVYVDTPDGPPREILGDFVVDATGRVCKGVKWITDIGYQNPPLDTYDPHLSYAIRFYENDGSFPEGMLVINQTPPYGFKGGVVSQVEGNKLQLMVVASNKVKPDTSNLEDWTAGLEHPLLHQKLKKLTPYGEVKSYKAGPSKIVYYNQIVTPQNFAVVGDAFAKFNPVYSQGLGCIALGAVTLDSTLRQTKTPDFAHEKVAQRYFKAMGRRYAMQWMFPKTVDELAVPPEKGRVFSRYEAFSRFLNYLKAEAMFHSPVIVDKVNRVMSGVANPMEAVDLRFHYELLKFYISKKIQSSNYSIKLE